MQITSQFVLPAPIIRSDAGAPRLEGLPVPTEPRVAADRVSLSLPVPAQAAMGRSVESRLVDLARSLRQAQQGAELTRVAGGAVGDIQGLVARVRHLSSAAVVEGASDDPAEVVREIRRLQHEIDHVALTTRFDGQRVAGPGATPQPLTPDDESGDEVIVPLTDLGTRSGELAGLGKAVGEFVAAFESPGADRVEVAQRLASVADEVDATLVRRGDQLAELESLFAGHLAVGQVAADNLVADRAGRFDEAFVSRQADDVRERLTGAPDLGAASHAFVPTAVAARLLEA